MRTALVRRIPWTLFGGPVTESLPLLSTEAGRRLGRRGISSIPEISCPCALKERVIKCGEVNKQSSGGGIL